MTRFLLDTHTLIWAQDESDKLSAPAAAVLQDPASQLLLSTATIWEIGIKIGIGKLRLSLPYRDWVDKAFLDLQLTELRIDVAYVERQIALPFHHRDPFDRLLAAQSLVERIQLVSADTIFDAYGVNRLWN